MTAKGLRSQHESRWILRSDHVDDDNGRAQLRIVIHGEPTETANPRRLIATWTAQVTPDPPTTDHDLASARQRSRGPATEAMAVSSTIDASSRSTPNCGSVWPCGQKALGS
jgi:hypothetical protein